MYGTKYILGHTDKTPELESRAPILSLELFPPF